MEIKGTTALVTGGASGLGLATIRRLHAAGAEVVILDLPSSPGAERVEELGERASFAPADVRDADQVGAALDVAGATGAPLRIVVNCAGVGKPSKVLGRGGPFPLDLFSTTVGINLIGTFNVIRLATERMAQVEPHGEERGLIVNTASVAAFEGQIGQAAYSASKAGIVGMTIPIARELAALKIRVNTIAPGLFKTPLLASLPEEAQASLGAQVPHPSRLGDPDEYASLVEFMVGNPMLNGETIRLDGAIRMAAK
ncbi:SDR family NAD(P)-dependent oxidoreductase [Nakamurella sp. YIM 132087]|uniref:SDR family NAD(P)-dependent oxidoreductase n=1 Tax=Nakamurella alba TaxID=2665158 RepID=A0A7K1FPB2_9ACTN|nr:3-hydroxyacyl-CoA dehydrogenase [Nakamurella alba]MTD15986.1 SDR family NAD(P)-dependent oxidoreductase [Nakamurella alba]